MVVKVKEIMSTPVIKIDENKTAMDVGKLMKKTRRGSVIVTRKGKPVGIISDSDLIKRVVAENLKADKIKAKDIMSKPLITIRPDDDILLAVQKMKKSNIHRLPVVEEGKVIGMISLSDIAKTSPEMLELLEYRLKMKEMPTKIKEEKTAGICEMCGNYSENLIYMNDKWVCEECKDEMKEWE